MSIQAMKQALEALEKAQPVNYCTNGTGEKFGVYNADPFQREREAAAIAALRAAITEAERQEPVAEIISNDTTYDIRILDFNYLGNGTKLYTTPQPAIPAEKPYTPFQSAFEDGYDNGWNDCREAMLAAAPKEMR